MNWIHSVLDRSSVPTWRYERAVRVLLESVLLAMCALPAVTGWHSAIAQPLVAALRLHQAETAREKASILGRAKEQGIAIEPRLIFSKRARLEQLSDQESVIAWTWPVIVPIVSAAETRAFGWAVSIGIVATVVRVWFDRVAMPAWRKSRVEWRREQMIRKENLGT